MTHQHNKDCQKFLEHISSYIDGELDEEICRQIETHLKTCQSCRIVVNTLNKTIELYQMDGKKTTLPPEARSRLFACLALKDDVNHDE